MGTKYCVLYFLFICQLIFKQFMAAENDIKKWTSSYWISALYLIITETYNTAIHEQIIGVYIRKYYPLFITYKRTGLFYVPIF